MAMDEDESHKRCRETREVTKEVTVGMGAWEMNRINALS
jgi:hypothetical protein